MGDLQALDRDRIRKLFDLRTGSNAWSGGDFEDDPHPIWRALREQAAVHEGTLHRLTGYPGDAMFHGLPFPESPHFTVFSLEACEAVYRDPDVFASSPNAVDRSHSGTVESTMLMMGGAQHRRYRGLVQPSFVPSKAQWWIRNWIDETVALLLDGFVDDGRAELNVDLCAAIPVLTITGSFGVPVEQALDIRAALMDPAKLLEIIAPIVAARREAPEDDLISVLVEAELTDEDGVTHRLSDEEIHSFAFLLLAAGSGTTWKQMGITLATLLQRPGLLARIRDDRELVRAAIEESTRWEPTDPMFSRWVTRDVELAGVQVPKGSVVHICIGAANRDPARWENPEEYDLFRPLKPSLAFGSGPHVCLGMHVARAEMSSAINALLDRLPNLRLDPDAEPPRIIGLYERGAMDIPVVWD
jgi:cytochrome P450